MINMNELYLDIYFINYLHKSNYKYIYIYNVNYCANKNKYMIKCASISIKNV